MKVIFSSLMVIMFCASLNFSADEIVNRVVIVVDEDVITLYDLQKAAVWNGYKYESRTQEQKRDLAEQLVNRFLIFQEINKTGGITIDKNVLNSAIQSIKKGKPDPGFTDADIQEYAEYQLLIQSFSSQRFAPLIKISEEDIREYFNNHAGKDGESSSTRSLPAQDYEAVKTLLEQRAMNGFLKDWLDKQKLIHKIHFIEPL